MFNPRAKGKGTVLTLRIGYRDNMRELGDAFGNVDKLADAVEGWLRATPLSEEYNDPIPK